MIQKRKKLANKVREIAQLEDIPNIGPAVAADLRQLGITSPGDLPGRENRPNSLDQYRSVNVGKMPFFVTIGIVEMFTSDTVAVGDSTTIM